MYLIRPGLFINKGSEYKIGKARKKKSCWQMFYFKKMKNDTVISFVTYNIAD